MAARGASLRAWLKWSLDPPLGWLLDRLLAVDYWLGAHWMKKPAPQEPVCYQDEVAEQDDKFSGFIAWK